MSKYDFASDDVDELVQCILQVLDHGDELDDSRKAARATYEKYFSRDAFNRAVSLVLKEMGFRITG